MSLDSEVSINSVNTFPSFDFISLS